MSLAAKHLLPPKPRAKTRDRVLSVALGLFNERGVNAVTTAEIAAAAGINEGNLYYYFQRKEQLAEALFEFLAAAMLAVADTPVGNPADPQSYMDYQSGWFGLMWDFRCFYRDGVAIRGMAPGLRERMRALNQHGQAAVRRVFAQMVANGLMQATQEQIEILLDNIWIVSSYWLDFRLIAHPSPQVTPADLAWGSRQVAALWEPYLTPQGG